MSCRCHVMSCHVMSCDADVMSCTCNAMQCNCNRNVIVMDTIFGCALRIESFSRIELNFISVAYASCIPLSYEYTMQGYYDLALPVQRSDDPDLRS